MQQAQPPQFSLQQLQEYILLKEKLTQKKPKEIEVCQAFLDWYNVQIKQVAKNLNLPITKNFKVPQYLDVKLVVKLELKK